MTRWWKRSDRVGRIFCVLFLMLMVANLVMGVLLHGVLHYVYAAFMVVLAVQNLWSGTLRVKEQESKRLLEEIESRYR